MNLPHDEVGGDVCVVVVVVANILVEQYDMVVYNFGLVI